MKVKAERSKGAKEVAGASASIAAAAAERDAAIDAQQAAVAAKEAAEAMAAAEKIRADATVVAAHAAATESAASKAAHDDLHTRVGKVDPNAVATASARAATAEAALATANAATEAARKDARNTATAHADVRKELQTAVDEKMKLAGQVKGAAKDVEKAKAETAAVSAKLDAATKELEGLMGAEGEKQIVARVAVAVAAATAPLEIQVAELKAAALAERAVHVAKEASIQQIRKEALETFGSVSKIEAEAEAARCVRQASRVYAPALLESSPACAPPRPPHHRQRRRCAREVARRRGSR